MKNLLLIAVVLLLAGCKEKYEAPYSTPDTGYLVVEGIINSGQGGTTITLSRTSKLDNRAVLYEKNALVKIEGDDNSISTLAEGAAGRYSAGSLALNKTRKYRLNITTGNGKQYLSDFVPVRNNPPIDSISWKRENGGLQLYASTHDPSDSTRYYQWEYIETWEIHSSYPAVLKYKITTVAGVQTYEVAYRDSSTFAGLPGMYYCYNTMPSSIITLGSSAKLSKDIIYLPIRFIEPFSEKLSVLYSIEVKQYSWSKEGYAFLESMKKNTEATGSVFDAQPSSLSSNIRCITDALEPVIGFVNICPVQDTRIFIKNTDLPGWGYDQGCVQEIVINNPDSIKKNASGMTPTYVVKTGPFGSILEFYATDRLACVDCTTRGTPVKPSFWP
jgi:Domain of unknown function (DUF4249)